MKFATLALVASAVSAEDTTVVKNHEDNRSLKNAAKGLGIYIGTAMGWPEM